MPLLWGTDTGLTFHTAEAQNGIGPHSLCFATSSHLSLNITLFLVLFLGYFGRFCRDEKFNNPLSCPIKTSFGYANRTIIHLKWPPSRVVPSPVLCSHHQCWNRLKDMAHSRTICRTPSWQSKIVISHILSEWGIRKYYCRSVSAVNKSTSTIHFKTIAFFPLDKHSTILV